MLQLNPRMLIFGVVYVVAVHAECVSQERASPSKPRVLYERDLQYGASEVPSDYVKSYFGQSNCGILTRLGKELLLNDPANSQLIVVDTKTLAETKVPLVTPAVKVQIDPQTDWLYLDSFNPIHNGEAKVTCYAELDALKNTRPTWSLERSGLFHHQQIRWLDEHQRFVVYSLHNERLLLLLDHNGVELAKCDLKGSVRIVGVDEVEGGYSIFYLIKNRNTYQFEVTQLDNEFNVRKTQKWPLVQRPQNLGVSTLGISRSFRLRGLKSGEVTKYFLEMAAQPGHLDMDGRLPLGSFTSKWFAYANKLSAAESSEQPEIILGTGTSPVGDNEFILFDSNSSFYHVPDQALTDAIFDEQRKLLVTRGSSKQARRQTVRLISFE